MLALAVYENGICACGFHSSLTHDPDNHFTWDDDVCPVCKGAAQWARIQADQDQQAIKALGENVPPATPRPGDGRRTFTRPMSPAEVQERRERLAQRRESQGPSRSA